MIEIDGKRWEIIEQSEDKIILEAVPEMDELTITYVQEPK